MDTQLSKLFLEKQDKWKFSVVNVRKKLSVCTRNQEPPLEGARGDRATLVCRVYFLPFFPLPLKELLRCCPTVAPPPSLCRRLAGLSGCRLLLPSLQRFPQRCRLKLWLTQRNDTGGLSDAAQAASPQHFPTLGFATPGNWLLLLLLCFPLMSVCGYLSLSSLRPRRLFSTTAELKVCRIKFRDIFHGSALSLKGADACWEKVGRRFRSTPTESHKESSAGPSSGGLKLNVSLSFLLYAYFHSFLCGGSENVVIMVNPAQKGPSERA